MSFLLGSFQTRVACLAQERPNMIEGILEIDVSAVSLDRNQRGHLSLVMYLFGLS
jgi:hypothetical protein